METSKIILFIVLIILTAIFVSVEFAIVKIRPSRIEQLVNEGNKSAIQVQKITLHLDEYLSATQLGISVAALGLGWVGEPTIHVLIAPLVDIFNLGDNIAPIISSILAFLVVTFLQVVVGELAPKTIAIQKAEAVALFFARPMIIFYKVLYPFIKLLNGSANLIVRAFGFKTANGLEDAHSEDELRLLLSKSYESGQINQRELNYVNNIFEFDERIAREIMVPRTKMEVINLDDTEEEIIKLVVESKHTRYPITQDGDKDEIIGVVNMKEYLIKYLEDRKLPNITDFINPILTVIESIPIHDLLLHMQRKHVHIAVLLDEYGGTSGIVSIEDIIEEIVGEIRDEFDHEEVSEIQVIGPDHYVLSGVVLIEEVNELLDIDLDDEDFDTIGGWMLSQQFELKKDQVVPYDDYLFIVKEMDGHQVELIEVKKNKDN